MGTQKHLRITLKAFYLGHERTPQVTDSTVSKSTKSTSKTPKGLALRAQYVAATCAKQTIDRKKLLVSVLEMARLLAAPSKLSGPYGGVVAAKGDTVDRFILEHLATCQAEHAKAFAAKEVATKAHNAKQAREAYRKARALKQSVAPDKPRNAPVTLYESNKAHAGEKVPRWAQRLQERTPEQKEDFIRRIRESMRDDTSSPDMRPASHQAPKAKAVRIGESRFHNPDLALASSLERQRRLARLVKAERLTREEEEI